VALLLDPAEGTNPKAYSQCLYLPPNLGCLNKTLGRPEAAGLRPGWIRVNLTLDVRGGTCLKDGEQRLPERVEVASRLFARRGEVEPAAEQLHAEQREDDDEEKQQQEEAGD